MNTVSPLDTHDDLEEAFGSTVNQEDLVSFKTKTVSGAISYTVRSLILYGIGLVTSLILGAYLSVEAFAVYGFVTQIIALLQLFSDVGLGPILIQKKKEPTLKEYRTVFTVQLFLSIFLFLIVVAIGQLDFVNNKIGHSGIWVLLSLGFSLPMASLKTISAIKLERKLQFSKLVIPAIAEQVIYNILMIALALSGYGVMSFAYAIFARSLIGVGVMWYVQKWKMGFALHLSFVKSMLSMGSSFQGSNILAAIKDQLFYLTLWSYLPATSFGYIMWSKSWSQVPYMLTVQNVIAITFPAYSRLQKNPQKLKKAIEKTLFFITASIFPILIGMSVFIYPLTQVISKYNKWEPAVITFVLFTLSIGGAAISTPLTNTLNAIGKVHTTLKLMIMWTILTWGLTFPALKFFGLNGVAYTAFVISLTSFLPIYFVKKYISICVWPNIWRQTFASAVMGFVGVVGMSIWSSSFVSMLIGMSISGIVYLIVFFVIGWKKIVFEVKSLLSKS